MNTLWPRTTIATAAVEFEVGREYLKRSRSPQIMADAACHVLAAPPRNLTGQCLIDENFLTGCGITNFDSYRNDPDRGDLALDLYVDE